MTIKFNIVERGRPVDNSAPKKYYPSIQSTGGAGSACEPRQQPGSSLTREPLSLQVCDVAYYDP